MSNASAVPRPVLERTEVLLRGAVFGVVASSLRFPSGLVQDLWVVEHPGAVAVAPVLESGELLLVRQYRHAALDQLLEIPAGRLEPGEAPLDAARRELEEETGHRASSYLELCSFFPAPGFSSEKLTLFEARGLTAGDPHPDQDEELTLVTLRPEQVLAVACDAKTLLAAALLCLRRRP